MVSGPSSSKEYLFVQLRNKKDNNHKTCTIVKENNMGERLLIKVIPQDYFYLDSMICHLNTTMLPTSCLNQSTVIVMSMMGNSCWSAKLQMGEKNPKVVRVKVQKKL